MKRRHFLALSAVALGLGALKVQADDKKPTEKDVLKEGDPAPIANYCNPDKAGNKLCPSPAKGKCSQCNFYNMDKKSEFDVKGKKAAKCTLLADPSKPQYVWANYSCATFVPKT